MTNGKYKKKRLKNQLDPTSLVFLFKILCFIEFNLYIWSSLLQIKLNIFTMTAGFSMWDYVVFIAYAILILGVGLWVSRDKKGHQKNAEDYFLASKSLPWWAIGASLIAANISAEQFIGMSGSGFALGLAIASYEWMAALTLIIVGKYFLPIFIEKGLYTIPEFVEKRFSTNLKTILAVFWLGLYVFVNLTSVLYLGGLAIETIMGVDMMYAIIGLALFAAAYSLYGGLSAVAWTDVIQVVFLVLGGLVTTYLALNTVSGGEGVMAGFHKVWDAAPEKFHMVLEEFNSDGSTNSNYLDLPGIWVLVGGLWVANLYYWGFNQYIIQRTLAAKSLKESQKGILLAAFLKLLIPLIVVVPGIAAYVMVNDPEIMATLGSVGQLNTPSLEQADKAYPWLLQFLPTGLKGVAFAALAAAIVSSLASMLNSTSTIFTMDIYKQYFNKEAGDKKTVNVGRITAAVALIIAVMVAPLLDGLDQAFQYIQEYTGLVSPGILAVFLLGLFWKKTTNKGAIWGAILSIPVALALKILPKQVDAFDWLAPWMHQMGISTLLSMAIIMILSNVETKGADDPKGIPLTKELFNTTPLFNVGAFVVMVVLAVLYAVFW
jgi:SSS family solute:Na+ symporter